MKLFLYSLLFFSFINFANAQPGMGKQGRGGQMSVGHFFGKIVDAKTNKPLAGATIQLTGNKFDTITKQLKQRIVATVISENNGDFSIEGLNLMGNFKFKATAIGYKPLDKQINFGISFTPGSAMPDAAAIQKMMALADKDLGNLLLEPDANVLKEVTVTSSVQQMVLASDRKVFNVDKSLTATGQTATELMKQIPGISVDIDGNVTLRNAAPTIFVDGRPTTLTLDQIPTDIIDKVEIITNPSSKFDASGGNAGILNLILKKNKKNGYNGGARFGIDSRARINLGGDINVRQNKINVSLSGNFNQRKSIAEQLTNTNFLLPIVQIVNSNNETINKGFFAFIRGGIDYLLDNRNTFSASMVYNRGEFVNNGTQVIDTSLALFLSSTNKTTYQQTVYKNLGTQLSYKHNFTKQGENIGADINFNTSNSNNTSFISNATFDAAKNLKFPNLLQRSEGMGANKFITFQTDYENLLRTDAKLEIGARAAIRNFETSNLQYFHDNNTTQNFVLNNIASSRYKFIDAVYALYTNYTFKHKKTNYQFGLRIESSNYQGNLITLAGNDSTKFEVSYALSLFPSAFITHKLTDNVDLQLNYSRRVNRPNFFQLLPSFDFSDPQNPNVGNPSLKPEFTHSFELSYSNNYKKNSNFLATGYFKYSNNLITRYLYKDINRNTQIGGNDSLFYGSFTNANTSYTYGLELTNKMPITPWWDLILNLNFYNSVINATLQNQTLDNNLISWFGKINSTIKVNKTLSIQLTCDNRSKTLVPQSSTNGGGGNSGGGGGPRGGGMMGGGIQASAQGYTLPRYFDLDIAIRKDFTFKNGKTGSLTLSCNDIFRTHLLTETQAYYFVQNTDRIRDQQVVRLNFSYRFGKMDLNLFKRKNTKAEQSSSDNMMAQ
jgi:outer membrane receptor protein involved in Fe transport